MNTQNEKRRFESFESLVAETGKELGVSDWHRVDQEQINTFAEATGDHQWIHVDVERSIKESPYGAPIAHGHLTLSLVPMLLSSTIEYVPKTTGINYGLDKVRFISPVKVDSKIRARFELVSAEERKPKHYLLKHNVTVEIDGEEKHALIAEWLGMTVVA